MPDIPPQDRRGIGLAAIREVQDAGSGPWECCGQYVCKCGKARHPPHVQQLISMAAEADLCETDEAAMSQVRRNALRDPSYCPYCLACPTMARMEKLAHMHWRCRECGAVHDERPNM